MTIDKRETPDKRAEREPTEAVGGSLAAAAWSADPDRSSRRVSFWRSVAGMALALALACAAIALETAFELSSRSASFHRRLELLASRVLRLRTEAADARRQLSEMRAQLPSAASINPVLTAADLVILPLGDGATNARGLLALSSREGGAIIALSGLSGAAGETCLMWWLLAKEPPLKAARFKPDASGRVLLAIRLPHGSYRIAGILLTLEADQRGRQGGIVLKGMFPRPEVLK